MTIIVKDVAPNQKQNTTQSYTVYQVCRQMVISYMGNLIVQHFKSPEKVQIQNWFPSSVFVSMKVISFNTFPNENVRTHTHRNNNYNNLTIPYLLGKQNSRSDF